MSLRNRTLTGLFAIAVAQLTCPTAGASGIATYRVKPDSRITHFDSASIVLFEQGTPAAQAPLVVFMPGTDGKPGNRLDYALMHLIVQQGYRVAWLSYDDSPSESKICPKNPDPACAEKFRRMRVYGQGPAPIKNPPEESVVARLTNLLGTLDREHPGQGWNKYLVNGSPDWKNMVVAGLSQGAGMAAYIAKTHEVARVVLFSSPWDDIHTGHHQSVPSPWLAMPSATPVGRWFAEYNKRENTADLIIRAYAYLRIPANHIHVFDLDLPAGYPRAHGKNPYHAVTIRDPRYAAQWKAMFGRVQPVGHST